MLSEIKKTVSDLNDKIQMENSWNCFTLVKNCPRAIIKSDFLLNNVI